MALSSNIVVLASCSVDFTTFTSKLPKPGETLHGTKFMTSFGGKGANQCVAAKKLGGHVHIIGKLGADQWGGSYKTYLEEIGVDTTFLKIAPNVSTGVAQIVVDEEGENQIVIVPGANRTLCESDVSHAAPLLASAGVLVAQLETPYQTTLAAFKISNGIKILNAAPALSHIDELLALCTILCVNESEATLLTGTRVDCLKKAVEAMNVLLNKGCRTVIITLGRDGAVYLRDEDKQAVHVYCDEVTAVDTTGAGDAFVGALATFLSLKNDLAFHQLVGAACDVATRSVAKEGTQTSYPDKYDVFAKEFKFENL